MQHELPITAIFTYDNRDFEIELTNLDTITRLATFRVRPHDGVYPWQEVNLYYSGDSYSGTVAF